MGFGGQINQQGQSQCSIHRIQASMFLFHQQWIHCCLCLPWERGAAAVLDIGSLTLFWLEKKQEKGWLVAPHRLLQLHKEAEIAVAKGWDQRRGPWGASHSTSRYFATVPGSFTPRIHLPVQLKIQEEHMLTIFLLQTCQVFYLLLFTPGEVW